VSRAAAACSALLACAACVAPVRARGPARGEAPAAATAPAAAPVEARSAAAPGATLRRAEGRVEVLLASASGGAQARVLGTLVGEVVLERRGARVRAGTEEREEWLLAPGPDGLLRVAERSYPGLVRVLPARDGGLELRAVVDLEDYLVGVVAAELAVWSAPDALLEAQAIAARSYAVCELDHRARSTPRPYLYDDTRDMAYRGDPPASRGVERARAAVERTRGRVLREGRRVLDARFHAACGGRTAVGRRVFPESDFASLAAVDCAPCREDPPAEWSTTATPAELDRLCRQAGLRPPLRSLRPAEVDAGGRWLEVLLVAGGGQARLPFEALRRELGPARVASALVLSTWPGPDAPIPGGLALRGRGSGHGVGLCQRGARARAEDGWSAERILAHYYPGAQLADGRRP
jgi:stage II sporulation protein D